MIELKDNKDFEKFKGSEVMSIELTADGRNAGVKIELVPPDETPHTLYFLAAGQIKQMELMGVPIITIGNSLIVKMKV